MIRALVLLLLFAVAAKPDSVRTKPHPHGKCRHCTTPTLKATWADLKRYYV